MTLTFLKKKVSSSFFDLRSLWLRSSWCDFVLQLVPTNLMDVVTIRSKLQVIRISDTSIKVTQAQSGTIYTPPPPARPPRDGFLDGAVSTPECRVHLSLLELVLIVSVVNGFWLDGKGGTKSLHPFKSVTTVEVIASGRYSANTFWKREFWSPCCVGTLTGTARVDDEGKKANIKEKGWSEYHIWMNNWSHWVVVGDSGEVFHTRVKRAQISTGTSWRSKTRSWDEILKRRHCAAGYRVNWRPTNLWSCWTPSRPQHQTSCPPPGRCAPAPPQHCDWLPASRL